MYASSITSFILADCYVSQALTPKENSYPEEADTMIKSAEGEEKQIEEQQNKQQAISEKDRVIQDSNKYMFL